MKKQVYSAGRVGVALLLLMLLAACVPPTPQSEPEPQGLLSFDDLTAKLDSLQGAAARCLTPTGASILTTLSGSPIRPQDLFTYLNYLKQNFGNYVKSITNGSPYHVVPIRVSSYPSADANNHPLSLSGLMWVPFTGGKHLAAPIISFQHGTQVLRSCAPSQFDADPLSVFLNKDQSGALQNYVECIVGGLMASAGYIVLMPDYPGFGESYAPHPFVHTSLGNSVRDLILAARERLRGVVTPSDKLFLTGYSEGGYATMAGAKVAAAAGIRVTGVVPCDGPYDISGVMLIGMLSGQPVMFPWYLLYTVFGYHSAYPGYPGHQSPFDYDALLNSPYSWETPVLFNGNHTDAELSAAVPPSVIPISMLTSGAVTSLSTQNGTAYDDLRLNNGYANWNVAAGLVFVDCQQDDVIPYQNTVVAATVLGGAQIVWVNPLPFVYQVLGSTHVAAFGPAMLAALTAIETMNRGH